MSADFDWQRSEWIDTVLRKRGLDAWVFGSIADSEEPPDVEDLCEEEGSQLETMSKSCAVFPE